MVRDLVERIRQKDQRAMSQLYKMYVKRLSSVCYRYVPNENDAKDVLQNSFVKIFTTIPTIDYQGEEAFWNWMKKVVANEALYYLRERKRLMFVDQKLAAQQITETVEPLLQNAGRTIILDCEKMPFISSSGLRIFLKIRKEVASKGGKMYLKNVCPDVQQVFKMTKLDDIFEMI